MRPELRSNRRDSRLATTPALLFPYKWYSDCAAVAHRNGLNCGISGINGRSDGGRPEYAAGAKTGRHHDCATGPVRRDGLRLHRAISLEEENGWGARIRTWECRYQKPMPYHLATPQPGPSARTERGKYITAGRDATAQCNSLQPELHFPGRIRRFRMCAQAPPATLQIPCDCRVAPCRRVGYKPRLGSEYSSAW